MKTKSILVAVAGIMAVSLFATSAQAGDRRRYNNNYNNGCYGGRSYGYYQPARYYQPVRYYQPYYRPVRYYQNCGPNPIGFVINLFGGGYRNCR